MNRQRARDIDACFHVRNYIRAVILRNDDGICVRARHLAFWCVLSDVSFGSRLWSLYTMHVPVFP